MVFITVPRAPRYHQMSIDEFLFDAEPTTYIYNDETSTHTYQVDKVSEKFLSRISPQHLISKLAVFNSANMHLFEKDRKSLYDTFYIPKKSGGLRQINAPKPELMSALRLLKTIFEQDFGALYHTTAFAYIRKRCTIDALKKHQNNESRWFGKFDLHDFFGSTTLDFCMQQLGMIFPFSEIIKDQAGQTELRKALSLAFLNGGLPQGTPISPLITNIIMIPIDHTLSRKLSDFKGSRFVYTRYADDFLVSSKYAFNNNAVEKLIVDTLKQFNAPFSINKKKTRYGSSAGQNWNLGLMLNKDNQITIGHKKKKQFQAMLTSYVLDNKNGKPWSKEDVQVLDGYWNYYRMVEGDVIDKIADHIGTKFGTNIRNLIKSDLCVA